MHGCTERHGYLLKVLIARILLDDGSIEFEVVVEKAIKQKMAYDNVDGQSPFIRLIGRNPRTRGVMERTWVVSPATLRTCGPGAGSWHVNILC